MEIVLYASSSEKERIDKSSYLVELGRFEGFLRAPSSVINPSINLDLGKPEESVIVDDDNIEVVDADALAISGGRARITDANYLYIPEFGRYYFIQDMIIGVTGLYQINASVDVLMSWKTDILNLNAFIERNEFYFDNELEDDRKPIKFKKSQTEIIPPKGNKVNTEFDTGENVNTPRIVMAVATDSSYSEGLTDLSYNAFGNIGLPQITPEEFASYRSTEYFAMDKSLFGQISQYLFSNDDKRSFVKSVVSLPFDPTEPQYPNTDELIYFGLSGDEHNLILLDDGHNAKALPVRGFSGYRVVADFTMTPPTNTYFDYPPYTRHELYIPFYGYVEINFSFSLGHRIIVYYTINYEDGNATAFVLDYTSKKILWSAPCQVGVMLDISTTNAKENQVQRTANASNLAIGTIGSAVSASSGLASGNPFMVAGAVVAETKAIVGALNSNMMLFDRAQTSNSGSTTGLFNFLDVKLRTTKLVDNVPFAEEDRYAHAIGRPLRRFDYLSELRGFTIAKSVHLDDVPCYSVEADRIIELLATGVII